MYRPVVMGKNGLVTSAHPLASRAGIEVLEAGGNAFDAAIAVSAVMGVVHPHSSGIGGDFFCLLYSDKEKKVRCLNGSGRSPLDATIEAIKGLGYERLPMKGVLSLTVPGCVHAWGELWSRYGSLSLEQLLRPAVRLAGSGFPVSFYTSIAWQKAKDIISRDAGLRRCFMPKGRLPSPGEIIRQEALASSLERVGREGVQDFYKGSLAREISVNLERRRSLLNLRDLEAHLSTWVEPLSIEYCGYRLYQTPPNTQGLAALLSFNILEGLNLSVLGCDTPEYVHFLVETKKIAYEYREKYITDPDFVPIQHEEILDKQFAARLRKMIASGQAQEESGIDDPVGDTAFFAVVDGNKNTVAGIQSLYSMFGAGFSAEETGIIFQNRGACFSLDPAHINRLEPHKRTFHTLTASLITYKDRPVIVFGASGGNGQPQTHLQVIAKLIHFGYNIQDAIESPRWLHGTAYRGDTTNYLNMESRFPVEVVGNLESWGHNVRMVDEWAEETGRASGIFIDQGGGVFSGGADPRGDDYVLGF